MECELNKFSRIHLPIQLSNCEYNDVKSASVLGDVQIFRLNNDNNNMNNNNNDKIQVLTELGPFEKKLIFRVKYKNHKQLSYSCRYNGINTSLNDITEYIRNSNNMFEQATEKYLTLQNKLNVSCFIHLEFPPLSASLMTKSTAANTFADTKAFEGLIWKRAIEFADYPHLFGPAIMLSDDEQGKLGNCGFTASLIAISIHPQLIQDLFLFPNNNFNENSVSPIGLYEMRLCHNGIWRQYTIDDLIPCNINGNPEICARSIT